MNNQTYKGKLRLRICGLLVENDAILLVQIHSPVSDSLVWMPPGGGLEFGESIEDCLKREFREETGLEITVGSLQLVNELVEKPFHAVELFYTVAKKGGILKQGKDPEQADDRQLIKDLKWIPLDELRQYEVRPDRLSSLDM